MSTRQVIIELSHCRMEVSLLRGRAPARSVSAPVRLNPDAWLTDVAAAAPALKQLISDLGAQGAHATLLYTGLTAVASVFSCARAAGRAQALSAARLALGESADFPIEANPHALSPLVCDSPADASVPPQTHTLGVAERDETAQALFEWLSRAGLVPRTILPSEVPAVAAAARSVLAAARSGAACALWIGEYGSVFAGASQGRLKFLRQIGIGSESLVTALAREVRTTDSGRPITLTADAARELLVAAGIPGREQMFDETRRIQGDAVLPLIQPVLQRWLVEIKQSLRFGFDEAERASVTLLPMGRGAAIPRLHTIVAEQCAITLAPPSPELGRGPADAWLADPIKDFNVLPVSVAGKAESFRLTRGMWVGVAAACLAMGVDAFITRADLARIRVQSQSLEARLQSALPGVRMKEKLVATRAASAAALARMRMRLAPCADWETVLAALARETPPRVRLSDIRMSADAGQASCRIFGETPLDDSSDLLKSYADHLASLPIVSSYSMGSTSRGESLIGPVQQFEMTLGILDLPPAAAATPSVAAAHVQEHEPEANP